MNESVKTGYQFFYKHKALLPVCFFIRIYKMIFKSRKNLKKEIQVIKNI